MLVAGLIVLELAPALATPIVAIGREDAVDRHLDQDVVDLAPAPIAVGPVAQDRVDRRRVGDADDGAGADVEANQWPVRIAPPLERQVHPVGSKCGRVAEPRQSPRSRQVGDGQLRPCCEFGSHVRSCCCGREHPPTVRRSSSSWLVWPGRLPVGTVGYWRVSVAERSLITRTLRAVARRRDARRGRSRAQRGSGRRAWRTRAPGGPSPSRAR
jgi:hypothetical protein